MKVQKVVPIIENDRPYTIEVYDTSTPAKVEVLRINIGKNGDKSAETEIEMGRYVKSNKVAPAILDENSILKADQPSVSSLVPTFLINCLKGCHSFRDLSTSKRKMFNWIAMKLRDNNGQIPSNFCSHALL